MFDAWLFFSFALQGAALSLATPSEEALLQACMAHQTPEDTDNAQSLIQPLDFRVADVEGFRYVVRVVSD